ncbi:sigma-54-dependent transcriptional regulator [Kiloniella sp. b19]|uniref:sigma-54-dependent transcriptional regulator n=1 Tax=Kiloniella sp. GXU_MW_B19 TaxID=3141326 RepID=UPI0031CF444B
MSDHSDTPSPRSPVVILIDDEQSLRDSTRQWLELSDYTVEAFSSADHFLKSWPVSELRQAYVTLVSDVKMPGTSGLQLLEQLQEMDEDLPVILMTGHGDVPMAVNALKQGAYDFIEKPFEPERLLEQISRALEKRLLVLSNRTLRRTLAAAEGLDARLIGQSVPMRFLKEEIMDIAPTMAPVLLQGETGSGKEVVAQSLHAHSRHADGPFVALNCAAIPEQMLESELFGHEKGAFTGAHSKRIGKLEAVNEGTLFLDELSSMPLDSQAKLLRVLEERQVTPLGSNKARTLNFRLVAAIQEDPQDALSSGRLRKDLYYRVSTVFLPIVPLRERGDDAILLFRHFLGLASETFGRPLPEQISSGTLQQLRDYDWPGNVRELRNFSERYLLSSRPEEQRSDILFGKKLPIEQDTSSSLQEQVQFFERRTIEDSLIRHKGNISAVMEELAVPRRTLNEKMQRYDLKRDSFLKDEHTG